MKEVRGYLASQLGFSETGRYVLDTLIKPRLAEIGITVIDPFVECGKELDMEYVSGLERYEDRLAYLEDFSMKITPINNRAMKSSHSMLPVLDGGHTVDDGVASEIGYYAGIEKGPIFALRSDFRLGENIAVTINAQILGYILQSGGKLFEGPGAMERWFAGIKEWYECFKISE